jgi:hypothetical protein
MFRVQMLDENDGKAGIIGQMMEKFGKGLQSSGGSPESRNWTVLFRRRFGLLGIANGLFGTLIYREFGRFRWSSPGFQRSFSRHVRSPIPSKGQTARRRKGESWKSRRCTKRFLPAPDLNASCGRIRRGRIKPRVAIFQSSELKR